MKCRIAIYYFWHLWASFRELLFLFGLKLRLRFECSKLHNIFIVDVNPSTSSSKMFFERTSAAMKLIMITDPRRFKSVQEQIKIIVNARIPVKASYHRNKRICTVDMARWDFEKYPELSTKDFACTLVHEAAHGRFCQARIPCIKQTRYRIEKACVAEEIQFSKKWVADSFDWNNYFKNSLLLLSPKNGRQKKA